VKVCGVCGVLDVASEAYGEPDGENSVPFFVLNVASDAYGEHSAKVCCDFGVLNVASEPYGELAGGNSVLSMFRMWPVKHMVNFWCRCAELAFFWM
jgi:hypothetical protein